MGSTGLLFLTLLVHSADAEGPDAAWRVGVQVGCEPTATRARGDEVPYNGLDDDCSPQTPDDDLDGDGRRRSEDCSDQDPEDEARIVDGPVVWDGVGDPCVDLERLVVRGDLMIAASATDLSGLSCLCAVTGDLVLGGGTGLESLDGLEQLRRVGGGLSIRGAQALTEVGGLGALEAVGASLEVSGNPSLTDLEGLHALTEVGGDVSVSGNAALGTLDGLSALEAVGGDLQIHDNDMLAAIEGLDQLSAVGGDLRVSDNDVLHAIDGLNQLSRLGGELSVSENDVLTAIHGLEVLSSVGGGVQIADNPELAVLTGMSTVVRVGAGVALSGNVSLDEGAAEARFEEVAPAALEADEMEALLVGDPGAPRWEWVLVGALTLAGGVVLFLVGPMIQRFWAEALEVEEEDVVKPGAEDFEHLSFDRDTRASDRDLPASLDGIPPRELMPARMHLHQVTVGLGDALIEEGRDDPALAWVVEGELEVKMGAVEVGRILPDEVVGEMGLFEVGKRSASVVAAMPTRVIVVDRSGYEALATTGSPVAVALEQATLRSMGRRLREACHNLARKSLGTRMELRGAADARIEHRLSLYAKTLTPLDPGPVRDPGAVLAETGVFSEMERGALQALANEMEWLSFEPGEPVYVQGGEPDAIYVLVHGRCDLMLATSQSTELQVIDDLFVGDVFGLASFFMEDPRMGSCLALSEVHVLRLSADMMKSLVSAESVLGRRVRIALIRALAASLREANGHLVGEAVGDQQHDHLRRARAVMLSRPRNKPLGG